MQLPHDDLSLPKSFDIVHNEPDTDLDPSISKNVTVSTIVDTDHNIHTPFIIGVWILSASIAKIGKFTSNFRLRNEI